MSFNHKTKWGGGVIKIRWGTLAKLATYWELEGLINNNVKSLNKIELFKENGCGGFKFFKLKTCSLKLIKTRFHH